MLNPKQETTKMPMFQIKNRWYGNVQFECELSAEIAGQSYGVQLGFAVRKAIEARADLTRANLTDADLTDANLTDADLTDANLARANLTDADLTRANLTDADLTDANLARANLTDANLQVFKQDLIAEVLRLPNELDALRAAIIEGRIDGSTYSGECACLAGTLAKARGHENYFGRNIDVGPITFHAESSSPRERWFMMISKGQTPENNQAARLALEWLDEAIAIRNAIRATAPKADV
jgi:Pentapeptide repeats (8 copies)